MDEVLQRGHPSTTRKYMTLRRLLTELRHSTQENRFLVAALLKDADQVDEAVGESLDVVSIPKWIFENESN